MSVSHSEIFSRCTSPFTSKIDLTWGSTLRFGILLFDYFLLRQTRRLKDCNHHTAFETKMDPSAIPSIPSMALVMIIMITLMDSDFYDDHNGHGSNGTTSHHLPGAFQPWPWHCNFRHAELSNLLKTFCMYDVVVRQGNEKIFFQENLVHSWLTIALAMAMDFP